MEKALDALVSTEAPIAEIGYDLGFSSQSVLHALLRRPRRHGADGLPPRREGAAQLSGAASAMTRFIERHPVLVRC